jgi:hypothetical protein
MHAEQITKYPDVTLQVLKGAGAVCGQGAEQKILKQCPKDRFCSLPTGEMCIYGIKEIPQMTQITVQEIAEVIAPLTGQRAAGPASSVSMFEVIILVVVFVAGIGIGKIRKSVKSGGS